MSYHRSDKLQNLAETREQKRDLCRETNRGGDNRNTRQRPEHDKYVKRATTDVLHGSQRS